MFLLEYAGTPSCLCPPPPRWMAMAIITIIPEDGASHEHRSSFLSLLTRPTSYHGHRVSSPIGTKKSGRRFEENPNRTLRLGLRGPNYYFWKTMTRPSSRMAIRLRSVWLCSRSKRISSIISSWAVISSSAAKSMVSVTNRPWNRSRKNSISI